MTSAPTTDEHPPDDTAERPTGVSGFDRLRLLLAVAMGTVLVSYAILVPSAAAAVLTGGAGMSLDAAFGTAVPLWLAAHHIPLVLDGQPLSVLPLLPTIGVLLVVAGGASWAVRRLGGRTSTDAGAVVAAIAGAHAAVAVLGSALLPATAGLAVAPWSAMVGGGLVAGVGAGAGVLRCCGLPAEWADRIPDWLRHGLLAAAVAVTGLLAVGALVLTAGVALRADAVTASFTALAPDGGSGVGVALLALAYLPNAVIGAVGWALGPGVAVGTSSATPFVVVPGEPPGFPLLAVLPDTSPPAWTGLVLLLPVAVGVLTGLRCHRAQPGERLPATLTASVLSAVTVAALAALAGGRLAAGPFDPIRVPGGLVGASVLLLVGLPALLMYLFRIGAPATTAAVADPVAVADEPVEPEVTGAAATVERARTRRARRTGQPARIPRAEEPAADQDEPVEEPPDEPVEDTAEEPDERPARPRRTAKTQPVLKRTPQAEREARAAARAARAARREKAATEEAVEEDEVAEPAKPRTVAELVALRAEQAETAEPADED